MLPFTQIQHGVEAPILVDLRLAGLVEAWASGCTWEELMTDCRCVRAWLDAEMSLEGCTGLVEAWASGCTWEELMTDFRCVRAWLRKPLALVVDCCHFVLAAAASGWIDCS